MTSSSCAQFRDSNAVKRAREQQKVDVLAKWYGMRRRDPTEEEKAELTVLKLRKYLQPGKFMRNDGLEGTQKYFEVGTIIEERLGKRKRGRSSKGTVLGEIIEHDEKVNFTKRKFQEIQTEKCKTTRNSRYTKLKRAILKAKSKKKI